MGRAIYPLVFFDVDSTLVSIEGIDLLARDDPEITRLTEAAMNGDLPIEEVYARRLERIRPSRAAIDALATEYTRSLVADAEGVISVLRECGVDVHLATAGILQAVQPLAAHLGIAPRAIHAVELSFDAGGNYSGFDTRSPLTRSRGKEIVVLDVRARTKGKAAFVGDGATDLEARDAVDLFIGFGGVRARESVRASSDVYIDEPTLRPILSHLLRSDHE